MWLEAEDTIYELSAEELEVLRRSAAERGQPAPAGTRHTKAQLVAAGLVREAFSRAELAEAGFTPGFTSSKDAASESARQALAVGSPHPSTIEKWQLPVDMLPFRPVMISFPPGSRLARKMQPLVSAEEPGGALRVVLSGSLVCNSVRFGPGDWFFVPNKTPYQLDSDPEEETRVLYLYRFPSCDAGGRFSYDAV